MDCTKGTYILSDPAALSPLSWRS